MSEATGAATGPAKSTAPRSPAEIEREIEAARARLASNVDTLAGRLSPASLAHQAQDSARRQVIDDAGQLRTGRVAAIAGVVLAFAALLAVRRRRMRD